MKTKTSWNGLNILDYIEWLEAQGVENAEEVADNEFGLTEDEEQ